MYMASNAIYRFAFIADVPFVKNNPFKYLPHNHMTDFKMYVSKKEMKEHSSLDTKRTSL